MLSLRAASKVRRRAGLGRGPWALALIRSAAAWLLVAGALGCESHVVLETETLLQDRVPGGQAGTTGLPGLGSVAMGGSGSDASGGASGNSDEGEGGTAAVMGGNQAGSAPVSTAGTSGLGMSGAPAGPDPCAGIVCDDGVACTLDSCQPATGQCDFDATSCECTAATESTDCEDDNPCTPDRCVNFACSNAIRAGLACDDGLACTTDDQCQADGSCAGSVADCEPPDGWTCDGDLYGDARCDCGCGVVDIDCAGPSIALCESCQCSTCFESDAACTDGACPVLATNNAECAWECPAFLYGNGVCTCGCGVVDQDCPSTSSEVCAVSLCDPVVLDGSGVVATNNALCLNEPPEDVPADWTCSRQFFGNGICDCGCGALDSDCGNRLRGQCEFCACADVGPAMCPVAVLDNTLCAEP